MPQFRVFENADISGISAIGEITIAADGAIAQNLDSNSPLAEKLGCALAEVKAAKSLLVRSEEEKGSGADRRLVMTIREAAPGDHAYPSAFISVLASVHGFRCMPVESSTAEEW
ncbi:MAG: hypothetical protein H6R18_392 [Proteobacteria bacterium]|nr:hypothetical protein [Pseudomonadota bacterium]